MQKSIKNNQFLQVILKRTKLGLIQPESLEFED